MRNIEDIIKANTIKKDIVLESRVQKFKPSKHKKAYRLENNFKKRCYAR